MIYVIFCIVMKHIYDVLNFAGSSLCSSHDDDDGRGRPVQDEMEASMEESHLGGSRQEDQGPHGRQGGAEENQAR